MKKVVRPILWAVFGLYCFVLIYIAIVFYKTKGGFTGSECIQRNTTDLEGEIGDMVERAKNNQ